MINRVTIVLAEYCPHCVPFSLQNARKMAVDFGVPLRILNIEIPEQEKMADRLIEKHGDWSVDYLIPQVFIEWADGRVNHILTGFSEAVTQTKSSWASLFSSDFYRNLLRQQPDQQRRHALKEFVERYLTFKAQCRRHCDKPSSFFELWFDLKNFVGAYVCSGGYVSRVVYFSLNPDKNWFRKYLTSQVGESVVAEYDLRPATRHGWELGSDALTSIREINPDDTIQEIYWTIYPKTDEEKRCGVFLCSDSEGKQKCNRLFVQDLNSQNRLCPACR